MGPEVQELEERLAYSVGVKHSISCSSGADAQIMLLMAYGIGPGEAQQIVAERDSRELQKVMEVPWVAPDCTSIWAQYSVLSDRRQVLQELLKNNGIPNAIY